MQQKTAKILEWSIFSFLALILALSGSLLYYQRAYAGKIYKNVSFADINLSGMTKKQASFKIQKTYTSILNDEITLKTNDKEVKTKVSDTGLELDLDKIVDESYKIGRSTNFFDQIALSAQTIWAKKQIHVDPKINEDKFNKFSQIAVAQLNIEPENAEIIIENGEIKQKEEKAGQIVDASNLSEKILSLAYRGSDRTIYLNTLAKEPTVKTANFEPARAKAQSILDKSYTFTYENNVFTPSKTEVGYWISFTNSSDQYSAVLNESAVQAYLNKIGKKFEVTKQDKKINAADGSTLEEGREGKYIDKNNAIDQIKNQLNSSSQINITLKTYAVAPSEVKVFPAEGIVPGRFEGKYIDVDLTQQKLCRIDGPNIVDCFIISSGKPGMATPTGTYQIFEKNPRRWSTKYGMWLPWWQQFKAGGWGLHELPETDTWKEVPDHLGTPISHGCVRLGVGPAETVYNWTEIGTTVYIHK